MRTEDQASGPVCVRQEFYERAGATALDSDRHIQNENKAQYGDTCL